MTSNAQPRDFSRKTQSPPSLWVEQSGSNLFLSATARSKSSARLPLSLRQLQLLLRNSDFASYSQASRNHPTDKFSLLWLTRRTHPKVNMRAACVKCLRGLRVVTIF